MIFDEVSKRANKEFAKNAIPGFSQPTIKTENDPLFNNGFNDEINPTIFFETENIEYQKAWKPPPFS